MARIEDIVREDMAWEDKASEGKDAVAVAGMVVEGNENWGNVMVLVMLSI